MTAQVLKGFLIVLVIIIIGVAGFKLILSPKQTGQSPSNQIVTNNVGQTGVKNGPSLSLSPTSGNYSVGQPVEVTITLDTKGEAVSGAEADILFDPTLLSVTDDKILQGKIFPNYHLKKVVGGKLKLAGAVSSASDKQFSGKGILGTVTFMALKKGTANLTIDFVDGATNKSNVTKLGDKITGINFLKNVANAAYTVK